MRYMIRNIPPPLVEVLRQKARKERRSLNDVVVESLVRGVSIEKEVTKNHDLDFAFGSWVEDPEFDKAMEGHRQIDPEMWK